MRSVLLEYICIGFYERQEEVPDAQLNQEGGDQAIELGPLLKNAHPNISTKFYSSPLGRAEETARLVAQYFTGVRIIKKEGLKEVSHGAHDGMDKKLRAQFNKQFS